MLQGFAGAKLRANKLAEAERLLQDAYRMNPGHSPTLVDLGRLRERLHDDAGADEYYRQAIAADTNNSFAYYLLARLTYRYNDIEEAFRLAKTAMTTDPLDERNRQLVKELKQKLMPPE